MATTKSKIIEHSLALFAENGFKGSSMRQIASNVGIRESSIYNHFKSKNEILEAIFKKYSGASIGANLLTDKLLNDLSKPRKFLNKFSEILISKWNEPDERKFIKLLMKENLVNKNEKSIDLNYYIEEARSIWEMIFFEMKKHKFLKSKHSAEFFAREFISPLYLLRIEYLSGEENIEFPKVKKFAKEHVEFFWNSISA